MRITNKMMTNNMLSNINKNKLNMSILEQQYSTGKRIQRPSEDPIIAVRALKLRTNLTELTQYFEKNIPDAMSWMDTTESALTTVNSILKNINTYCVQGSSDTLTASDRSSIVQNLEQMKEQIYQEGNTNYAGRYVFTGYKTDSSLTFTEDTKHLNYDITEETSGEDIQFTKIVAGSLDIKDAETATEFNTPEFLDAYRIQLSYDKLDDEQLQGIKLSKLNSDGEYDEDVFNIADINKVFLNDANAYKPEPGKVNYIPETGELILAEDIYEQFRKVDKIEISYSKSEFKNGDLKPEHYFDCEMTNTKKPEEDPIRFSKVKQAIQYEVNYNQKLTVNTEGSDAITHDIGRCIDDILKSVNDVVRTEEKIAEVEKWLKDTSLSGADKAKYEELKEQLDTELELKKDVMQKNFSRGITVSNKEQNRVNAAVADLGSRYVRLELTKDRLSSQKIDFEDMLSKNEDADIVETVIKYTTAEALYNSSLSAAAKVVQNSLLDFLR